MTPNCAARTSIDHQRSGAWTSHSLVVGPEWGARPHCHFPRGPTLAVAAESRKFR